MHSHESDPSVRSYRPEMHDLVLSFLAQVDHLFVPPLSSHQRQGSLAKYLEYALAAGQGRVLLYFLQERPVGLLAYRVEPAADGAQAASIYLSTMCVTESLMGTVLMRLFQAMLRQVEAECACRPQRIWAKTWSGNRASARTLQRLGLQLLRTVPADPAFHGVRDTLVFEANWDTFADSVRQLAAVCNHGRFAAR